MLILIFRIRTLSQPNSLAKRCLNNQSLLLFQVVSNVATCNSIVLPSICSLQQFRITILSLYFTLITADSVRSPCITLTQTINILQADSIQAQGRFSCLTHMLRFLYIIVRLTSLNHYAVKWCLSNIPPSKRLIYRSQKSLLIAIIN